MIRPIGVATSAWKSENFGARAIEAEEQPHQQLAGADQHRGAVAGDAVDVVVHGDDAAGAGLVLHHDGGLPARWRASPSAMTRP